MLIAELTVLVFAMQSILCFIFFFPPSLQLVMWFLLLLISLFLRSDPFTHRASALRLHGVCQAGQCLLCSFCTCWDGSETSEAPQFQPGSAGGAGQGLDPPSMDTGLLLHALPEVGCVPRAGDRGCSGCCGASAEPFPVLSAVPRAGAVSPWLIPRAGMLWEFLPTPRGSELP